MVEIISNDGRVVKTRFRELTEEELSQQRLASMAQDHIKGSRAGGADGFQTYAVQQGPRARKKCDCCGNRADYRFQWHIAYADYICNDCLTKAEEIAGQKAATVDKDYNPIER